MPLPRRGTIAPNASKDDSAIPAFCELDAQFGVLRAHRAQSSSGSATATEPLGRFGLGLMGAGFHENGSRGDAGGLRRRRRITCDRTRLNLLTVTSLYHGYHFGESSMSL